MPVTRTRTTCARRSARRSRFERSPLASRDHTLTRLVRLQLRIAERNSWFEEGIKLDEEARARRVKLDDAKKKKLDQLRFVLVTSLCPCMSLVVFLIEVTVIQLYDVSHKVTKTKFFLALTFHCLC